MASLSDSSLRMKISVLAVASLLILLGILYAVLRPEEKKVDRYSPVVELPADFAVIVDHPLSIEDRMAIACLTPVLFQGGGYHPLIILNEDNSLPRQVIYTLTHLKRDYTKILFTDSEGRASALNGQLSGASLSQIEEENVFPLTADICSRFIGFDDIITVSSYEEALWAAPIARHDNMALVKGEPTFTSQEHAWSEMRLRKIPADYIIATNPYDHDLGTLKNNTPDYDDYDDPWFCPDLSLAAAELAAYHNAYVITNTTTTDTVD